MEGFTTFWTLLKHVSGHEWEPNVPQTGPKKSQKNRFLDAQRSPRHALNALKMCYSFFSAKIRPVCAFSVFLSKSEQKKFFQNLIKFKDDNFCKISRKTFLKNFIKSIPTTRYIHLSLQKCKVINWYLSSVFCKILFLFFKV